jgi:hypothetical protein
LRVAWDVTLWAFQVWIMGTLESFSRNDSCLSILCTEALMRTIIHVV